MATLDSLKRALREKGEILSTSSLKRPLSDTQYNAGFEILVRGPGWMNYEDFMIPQLSKLLAPLLNSRAHISVLEIGPGPKSLLGYLPHHLRHKVKRYTALEPNGLFATKLETWLCPTSDTESPLPSLGSPPQIHRTRFAPKGDTAGGTDTCNGRHNNDDRYDLILFCHSMYGMKPKRRFIERALELLTMEQSSGGGLVVVFHRDNGALHLEDLVCHRTASFPAGVVGVADEDDALDCFASFVAGYTMRGEVDADKAIRAEWRNVCRALGRRDETDQDHLLFSSPEVMVGLSKHATALPELTAQVPVVKAYKTVKNREALSHHPVSVVRPTEIKHVQQCVRWATQHEVGLAVVGGGHSGHCLWPNVVSVDMSAFDQIQILTAGQSESGNEGCSGSKSFIVAEAGCKTGDIIRKTMAEGLTVPLGARPSVGAGLWLQGGIGHLARSHGLACDAIVGAVIVSVNGPGQILYVGHVPSQHRPPGSIRPENEADLLWAVKGAGTNFGIVISVTFKAYAAPTYQIQNSVIGLADGLDAQLKLSEFDNMVAKDLPRNCSADAFLYWDAGRLHLGVTKFEALTEEPVSTFPTPTLMPVPPGWGLENGPETVDGVGLFDAEMYISGMHGGHSGDKTSSFKRCLFLQHIGEAQVTSRLVAAVESRPSPLCYLHLLQGGGAVSDVAADATAFGCRNWDFACVITGVWPRDQDGTEVARSVTRWVYNVAGDLSNLGNCIGAYGADLGPDPRDAALATKAFGPNRPRVARLKRKMDPRGVLAYSCPLPKSLLDQKLIILVTGESCAGKDFCADIWVSVLTRRSSTHREGLNARAVSISSATKREYAAATKADLGRLLWDRAYKEEHRPALTAFFKEQARLRPQLPEEHFLDVVHGASDVDVLFITGMRDESPVAAFSHLVPDNRLLEVHVQASEQKRRIRRGGQDDGDSVNNRESATDSAALHHCPSLMFHNDTAGSESAEDFAQRYLLPFVDKDLQRLSNMVHAIPEFPRPGIQFRHVLGISEHPGGLELCVSLLQKHYAGDWAEVEAVACCEAGGYIFASPLALRVEVPLLLIRDAGKLPPPTISVPKHASHVSSLASGDPQEKRIEMSWEKVPRGASAAVVVVDDVLSSGKTLCAMLQLLEKAGIRPENVGVMVVVEFPLHRGRELLRQRGFGRTNIQSLLVFGGA
ncbi:hypothetical protein diail_2960 [Diaporthe ilicicola]|nr:hypothetical protein diail_2960 [Diaporthe ilicicola]